MASTRKISKFILGSFYYTNNRNASADMETEKGNHESARNATLGSSKHL